MEIAAILIALAAVGIACWALGEARKDEIDDRLLAAEAAYIAHADNLTKKVRESLYGDKRIAALQMDMCDLTRMVTDVELRMDLAFEDHLKRREAIERNIESLTRLVRDTTKEDRRRFNAIEDYWGVNFRLTLTPAQPERVFFKVEKRSDDGSSSETGN